MTLFVGIYHHAAPAGTGLTSHPVAKTWTNEAIAFASGYAAKSALLLKQLLP